MSWIDEIPPEAAEGRLERSYRGAVDAELGRPANVITVHSVHPSTLDAHMALYRRVVKSREQLPQSEREAIATAVSSRNDCLYCAIHHRVSLVRALDEESAGIDGRKLGNAMVAHGRRREELGDIVSARLRVMVQYAMALTSNPGEMCENDLGPLRQVGLSDLEIFELNQVVSYFNYVNRIVMGLGVELEPEYRDGWTDVHWDG